jgi:endonuclease/exonuclease/phosphatase family metal-dependent hydrolase
VRLVTLNVRNPSFDDGPNAWPHRRDAFFAALRRLNPDLLCLQETIVYGAAREEGENAERCAILRRENTPVADTGTEWLGETPDEPGTKGWGADCPRVVTWVDFGLWTLFNVHLDHVSLEARTNGMAQVIRKADALGKPAVIVGDLNATPDEPAMALARSAGFVDLAEETGPTFHGFGRSRGSTTSSPEVPGLANVRGSSGTIRLTATTGRWPPISGFRDSSPRGRAASRSRRSPRRRGPSRRPPSSRGRRRRW